MRLALLATMLPLGSPVSAAVSLDWDAPAGCPSAQEVRARLAPLVSADARGHAQARVHAGPDGYELVLAVTTRHGHMERTLDGPTCESLAQATAVMVAVMVDPLDVATRHSVPPPDPVTTTPTTATRPPMPAADGGPPARPAAVRDRRPTAIALGLTAGGSAGLLPRPHAFVRAWVGPSWRRMEAHLIATHRFAQPIRRPAGGGAVIRLSSAGVGVGPVVRRGPWSVRLAAELEAGVMIATGRDLDTTRTALSPWLGAGLGSGVAWSPVPWVGLRLAAGVTGSILRPSFALDDGSLLHETSLLGARAGLGVEFRLPLDPAGPGRRPRG